MKLADVMTEGQFLDKTVLYAETCQWLVYHTYDSRRSAEGFPDLVLCRGERLVFAELKSAKGRLTRAQIEWRVALLNAKAEYYLWRPSDWPQIETTLA